MLLTITPAEQIDLVHRYVASGDTRAVERLLGQYDRMLRGLAHQYRVPGHEPEDLYQECVVRLLTVLPRYEPDRGGVGTFVYNISKNWILNLMDRSRQSNYQALDTSHSLHERNEAGGLLWEDRLVAADNTEAEALEHCESLLHRCQRLVHPLDQQILAGIAAGRSDREIGAEVGRCAYTIGERRRAMLEQLRKEDIQ